MPRLDLPTYNREHEQFAASCERFERACARLTAAGSPATYTSFCRSCAARASTTISSEKPSKTFWRNDSVSDSDEPQTPCAEPTQLQIPRPEGIAKLLCSYVDAIPVLRKQLKLSCEFYGVPYNDPSVRQKAKEPANASN